MNDIASMALSRQQLKRLKALGTVVRRLRGDAMLSQEGLAELADLERSYISDIERGTTRNPSFLVTWRIAEALGVKLSKLIALIEAAA